MVEDGLKIVDCWCEEDLDCRLSSPLYDELLKECEVPVKVYKLDAEKFPGLASQLQTNTFPTLLLFYNDKEIYRHTKYIPADQVKKISETLGELCETNC